jgi:hypothetical protein
MCGSRGATPWHNTSFAISRFSIRSRTRVVDGDPLRNLGLLEGQGRHLNLIMKGGKLYKNRLN